MQELTRWRGEVFRFLFFFEPSVFCAFSRNLTVAGVLMFYDGFASYAVHVLSLGRLGIGERTNSVLREGIFTIAY